MDVYFFIFPWVIYSFISSFCLCLLKQSCIVMEKKDFQEHGHLMFHNLYDFDKVNFTVAAFCNLKDSTSDLKQSLLEVPMETDWLCLSLNHNTVKNESFSQLKNLRALYIYGIFILQPGSFQHLPKLLILWINPSNYMTIDNTGIQGLSTIQQLKLSGVTFTDVNKHFFEDFYELEDLILENNNISSLSLVTKSLTNLTNLQNLSIILNKIEAITTDDCLSGTHFNMTSLTLLNCEIKTFERNSLCNFPKLSFFQVTTDNTDDLFYSGVKRVDSISFSNSQCYFFPICFHVAFFKLRTLDLSNVNIKDIETSNGTCKTLRILNVSFNYITKMTFAQMKKLKTVWDLNLSNNQINGLSLCPYKMNSSLIKMELLYLNLSFNKLTILQHGQLTCLRSLRKLVLNDNRIHTIKNCSFCGLEKLEVLNLEFNYIYKLGEYDFKNLFSLKQLNLKENVLEEIEDWAFLDLHQLEEITLTFKNNVEEMWAFKYIATSLKKLSLKSNDLYITLLDYINAMDQLESLELEANFLNVDDCEHFAFFKIRELRIINSVDFNCLSSLGQPLEKFTNLEKLYISSDFRQWQSLNIFNSTLKYLRKLEFLQLESTEKAVVSSLVNTEDFFQGLINLKTLYLKSSGIEYFTSEAIFKDLKSLIFFIVEDQHIQELKENIFSSLNELKYIYLSDSSLACSCELSWLNEWLAYNEKVSFIDYSSQSCLVGTQSKYYNLVSFLDKNCKIGIEFTFFINSLSGLLIFMLISLFHESLWWYIQYVFYTIKCWLNHRWRKRIRGQYEYDVFASYNTQNEQWITEQLLPNLEECGPPFFKVCIHNRDFVIGRDIIDNIMDSLYKSRWTICLISHGYLQSNWCSLEMRMATYRLVAESKDSLIIVFLDKISREELQYHHKLTKLLNKKTYLDWPDDTNSQRLFWARLRKVIGGEVERN